MSHLTDMHPVRINTGLAVIKKWNETDVFQLIRSK